MVKENQMIIIGLLCGFAIGVCSMMMVNINNQASCYEIIQNIEMEVCEQCWHEVFEMGEKYEEVQYYINGE
tara:strand:+ start:1154 stop:1366 length:213 start_codon:yes stop_codon:yes gene_type:complete